MFMNPFVIIIDSSNNTIICGARFNKLMLIKSYYIFRMELAVSGPNFEYNMN